MKPLIENIIQQYQEVQNGKLWIGSTFTSKLNQVDESMVFIRPITGLHSIAEIISHLTLWRKETILKIETGEGSKTDDCEENWLSNDKLELLGWPYIKSEYDKTLITLIDLLKSKDDNFLNEEYFDTDFKGNYTYSFVINGMLHHDIYHLGQLGIIIKYLKENN
ncbi:DinB family protein [Flagellimonas hymeniacidonis]|uniref:DinB family protein n=1 Tax=Flagellimonas hymeniacidonis TaxID=2603628 RepID=A0A5C8VAG3_9FLAO|nr:DinB family protein [Flagellimonas hymeniacidonis]TXN38140.1 DinB family protein [Flagellimonas hymeniacidonis]